MKNFKKIIAVLIVAVLAVSVLSLGIFAAADDAADTADTATADTADTATVDDGSTKSKAIAAARTFLSFMTIFQSTRWHTVRSACCSGARPDVRRIPETCFICIQDCSSARRSLPTVSAAAA